MLDCNQFLHDPGQRRRKLTKMGGPGQWNCDPTVNGISCSTSARAMLSAIEEYKCTKRSTAVIDVRIVISDAPIHVWFAEEVVLRRIRSQKQSS